jgi:hypothetical protein
MLRGNSNTLSIISINITKIRTNIDARTIPYRNKGLHRDDACDMRSMEICDFFHCSCSKENRETDDRGPFIFFSSLLARMLPNRLKDSNWILIQLNGLKVKNQNGSKMHILYCCLLQFCL